MDILKVVKGMKILDNGKVWVGMVRVENHLAIILAKDTENLAKITKEKAKAKAKEIPRGPKYMTNPRVE